MEDVLEQKTEHSETNDVSEVNKVSEQTEHSEVVKEKKEKSYFSYYLFILINSIIGFIIALYFSRTLIDALANKNIIDLKSIKTIVSLIIAVSATMVFMLLTLVFKKVFRKLFFSEIFLYIYIGGLTTIINILSWNFCFTLINRIIVSEQIAWKVAEGIAFIIAIIFAFFADKIVVFKSYSFKPEKIFTEMGVFVGARLFTELVNVGLMILIIDYLKQEPLLGKIIASIVVIIINYLFSKFVVFKKKVNQNEKQDK